MSTYSTQNLQSFPSIGDLSSLLKSLAVLDSILEREWAYRYYSYDSAWGEMEEMGSMRNGQGDEFFVLFTGGNSFIKGFDHESAMSPWRFKGAGVWPGVLDSTPMEFERAVHEPAFSMGNTTFCIWRRRTDTEWLCGDIDFPDVDDPDGSKYLLELFDCLPESYQNFAKEYFEMDIPLKAITSIYSHMPITQDILTSLNKELTIADISSDLKKIGYPIATAT